MSSEDLATLARMWEQMTGPFGTADERRALRERWWHPDIVYEEDPRWPGSGTYQGRDAVHDVFESYIEMFTSGETRVERIVDANDQLVALIRFESVVSASGVPTDHLWGYLCRVRDGKLIHLRAYWDSEEALAAAGASPP